MLPVSRLKRPLSYFSVQFCLLVISVLLILDSSFFSSGSDQYSSALFYKVLTSFCQWINDIFNDVKSSSSHFICQHHLGMQSLTHRFLVLWSICLSSSQVHFKNDREYLTWWTAQVIILIWEFFTAELVDSFPMESEWQQAFSSLFDSSSFISVRLQK